MKPHTVFLIAGYGLALLGAIDLLLGNTGHTILPAFIADHLDQQEDLALLGIGAGLVFVGHGGLKKL